MGATKMLTKDMARIIPLALRGVGRPRMAKHGLRASTAAPEPQPRPNPFAGFADDLFLASAGPALLEIRNQAALMAGVDVPVLLVGLSAVAQDVVVRLIHRFSPRRDRAFAQVSCGSFSPDALERELFGCEIQTPFGTTLAKPGLLEAYDGGTVLLNDITAMPWRLQARLLDLLDERRLCRADGIAWVNVDVRIVASTSMEIEQALAAGQLRRDLYDRLSSFALYLRPSREVQKGTERMRRRPLASLGAGHARTPAELAALREAYRQIPGLGIAPS